MIDYNHYWNKGITYQQYLENFEKEITNGSISEHKDKLPINWQRTSRINKTFALEPEELEIIRNTPAPLKWLVITEHWCGDSAQIVPVINKIAEASNDKIELKIVYRDENLPLMDAHLFKKGRSIPKLLQLNESMRVVDTFGPRPTKAQELVEQLKANPETAAKYAEELHKWYAKDKQMVITRELLAIIP